jgi:anaerobic selenocysteine-containing dehydrogenase
MTPGGLPAVNIAPNFEWFRWLPEFKKSFQIWMKKSCKQEVRMKYSGECKMSEYRRSYCGLYHPRCGLLLEVEDGKIVSVKGDPEHPVTRGKICERGLLMADNVHHPDRLNYPLKRKDKKGSGQWQRLTWEQALDEVAEKLANLERNTVPRLWHLPTGPSVPTTGTSAVFSIFSGPRTYAVQTTSACARAMPWYMQPTEAFPGGM